MLGTKTITSTMHAMAANSHTTWRRAVSSGVRRKTKQMPMPASKNAMGRMPGSACGAKMRVKMCATTKATMRPMGTAKLATVSSVPWLTSSMTKSSSMTGAAAIKSQSSVVRLECIGGFLGYWFLLVSAGSCASGSASAADLASALPPSASMPVVWR